MVGDNPLSAGGYRIRMAPFPQNTGRYPGIPKDTQGRQEGFPSSRRGNCTLLTGRKSFRLTRYMYLVDWKDFLPAGEVFPSGQRVTCTYLSGPLEGGYPRIPASGCGFGWPFYPKKQPYIRMRWGHLYEGQARTFPWTRFSRNCMMVPGSF
jgi:hypothetical protein